MNNTKKIDDYNVSFRVRKGLERAAKIADILLLDEVDTLSFFMGLAMDLQSVLTQIFLEFGIQINPEFFISGIINDSNIYEIILKRPYPVENEEKELAEKNESDIVENETDEKDIYADSINAITEYIMGALNESGVMGLESIDTIYSKNLQSAIMDAGERCMASGKSCIDEENLLYSIFNLKEDCSVKRFINYLSQELNKSQITDINIDIIDIIDSLLLRDICFGSCKKNISIPKPLENCCEVLNNKYEEGAKCDILCRDEEIFSVWNILSKKQKSNVILVGEAGVGKSAIVEAITMQIVNGTCPAQFLGYSVINLNIVGMVAGTKYRGEFEKKVEHLIKFIENHDKIIVFVDEVHQIMGAGSAEGTLDLSGSLKPILARDKVKFIGATTSDEYKKYICRDDAFRRRLEVVEVKEPKQGEVLKMLELKIKSLKKFHGVRINKDVLHYIQICAACFNTSTYNPDKTVDLIDRAMAVAKMLGNKSVSIRHVETVFKSNYAKLSKISDSYKMSTAYHEAGHFVAHMLYKDILVDEETFAVSIVPGFNFMGVNIIEETDTLTEGTKEYFNASIATLLAGRIAESFYSNNISAGASNDLGKATSIAKRMILEYGLSNEEMFKNISVYDETTFNDLPLSQNVLDNVTKEASVIVKRVYAKTEQLLRKHEDKISFIARELMKKKIIEASNYTYLFEEK